MKAKVKYSHKMEKAFICDEIASKEEHLRGLRKEHARLWKGVTNLMKWTDRMRISAYISKVDQQQDVRNKTRNEDHLRRLKKERFGNTCGQYSNIFNLADLELTTLQKEVLSRGLKFGIPANTSREEILAEFEVLHQQLRYHQPVSEEAAESCRIRLANAADTFARAKNNQEGFSLKAKPFKVIRVLKANKDIVILRPDKGHAVVLMGRSEYIKKMLQILEDTSKFERLGQVADHDSTARIERSIQTQLLKPHKAGEIPRDV